jgi:hypothetical protein
MSITVCGHPGTAKVIHRGYPQAASFHVKRDVGALLRLWIGRCKARGASALFHVKQGFASVLNRLCAQVVDSGGCPWLVRVLYRVVARETGPEGRGRSLPVDNSAVRPFSDLVTVGLGSVPG